MLKRVYKLPNGIEKDYDIVDGGSSAVVVPVTENKTVIMVKVFRPAQNKILMEFPGGFIDCLLYTSSVFRHINPLRDQLFRLNIVFESYWKINR